MRLDSGDRLIHGCRNTKQSCPTNLVESTIHGDQNSFNRVRAKTRFVDSQMSDLLVGVRNLSVV